MHTYIYAHTVEALKPTFTVNRAYLVMPCGNTINRAF